MGSFHEGLGSQTEAGTLNSAAGSDGSDEKALWSGRFSEPAAPEAHRLGVSLHFDRRLVSQELKASAAHVEALRDADLLSEAEATALLEALRDEGAWLETLDLAHDDEDVHMAIERELTERLGEAGAKLHAGRSRNDLVVTDYRLWLLDEAGRANGGLVALVRALAERAREGADHVMPGYTHNRPAQVVTAGYVLAAHAVALLRDVERLDQWTTRTSVSPLGAGALATSTLGLDASKTADRLGFARSFDNAMDAVSDRDFAIEFCSVAAILGVHLSRLAADLARWSEPAFGFVEIDEAFSTGSSMMPQKRNPDVLELTRGKAARLAGDLVTLLTLTSALPSGYHRDLQEDKESGFDAAETVNLVLPAMTGCVATFRFVPDAMRAAAADEDLYATDLAEALVAGGVPFREAHRRTGELLKVLSSRGRVLRDMSDEEWRAFGVPNGAALLDPDASVRARSAAGGPSPDSVRAQVTAIEAELRAD